jgi:hypothetical protein
MAIAPSASSDPTDALIGGQYAVNLAQPLPGAGGGLASFAVTGHPSLMAVQVQRQLPVRLRALQKLTFPLDTVLGPIAHGVGPALPEPGFPAGGSTGYFVICRAPPGPSVAASLRPWREADLLDLLLRPVALGLEVLHGVGITHRAIRPDNVFQVAGQPVVLGAAWAAPPAALQPAIFEPPYAAICLPGGRGDGTPPDDIYALGVLLLTLTLGRVPLTDLEDAAILQRKLELGSYAALVAQERLSPGIAELIKGMLAEDPDHRPSAALLDPPAARARRVAARPSRRAQRALEIGGVAVWSARQAAYALANHPVQAIPVLRSGRMDHWLRHGLGDAGMAARLDEVVRYRVESQVADPGADALLAMRCVALLDPLAPLCWQGLAVWPDGIGAALAGAWDSESAASLTELIRTEAIGAWAQLRPDRCDVASLRTDARQMQAVQGSVGYGGGLRRICYQLNPLLPCASPLLAGRFVARLGDLLPALDAGAGNAEQTRPMDAEIAAFIGARSERRLDGEVAALTDSDTTLPGALAQLRMYAQLQSLVSSRPLPALAGWLATRSGVLADVWFNRDRRAGFQEQLNRLAADGRIGAMLSLIEDRPARDRDREEAMRAVDQLAGIDAELGRLRGNKAGRADLAYRLGQEIAAGLGLAALAGVLTTAAFG